MFCKAMILIFAAGLEGWGTRESKTAVEKRGQNDRNNPHMFLFLLFFCLKRSLFATGLSNDWLSEKQKFFRRLWKMEKV